MKTWMIISINQNGDMHYFYPKAKNMDDAFEMGKKECIRISDQWIPGIHFQQKFLILNNIQEIKKENNLNMNYQHELQEKKIAILKEIATTSIYSMQKSTDLHCEYDNITQQQMELILKESGYDVQWPIGEHQITGILKIAFALGKKEQADIYYNGIVK